MSSVRVAGERPRAAEDERTAGFVTPDQQQQEGQTRQYEYDPSIFSNLYSAAEVISERPVNKVETKVLQDDAHGSYALISGGGVDNSAKLVRRVHSVVSQYLTNKFDVTSPREALVNTIHAAQERVANKWNSRFNQREMEASGVFMRFYEAEPGNPRVAAAGVGASRLYLVRGGTIEPLITSEVERPEGNDDPRAVRLKNGFNNTGRKFEVTQVRDMAVELGDRYVMLDAGVIGRGNDEQLDQEVIRGALQQADPQEAARSMIAAAKTPGERGVVFVDYDTDVARQEIAQANRQHSGATKDSAEQRSGSQRPDVSTKLGLLATGAMMKAGNRWRNMKNRRNGSQEDQTVATSEDDAAYRQRRKKEIKYGVIAGVLATGLILKDYGFDMAPTDWPIVGGDGDPVDTSPVIGGAVFGENSWFGGQPDGWLTDDITNGVQGIAAPDPLSPGPNDGLSVEQSPPTDGIGEGQLPNGPDIQVPGISGEDMKFIMGEHEVKSGDGWINIIEDIGEKVIGDDYTSRDASHFYEEHLEDHLTADSVTIGDSDKPGSYRMANGDWGLARTGQMQFELETAERLARLMSEAKAGS